MDALFRYQILNEMFKKFRQEKILNLILEMQQMTEKKYEPKSFSEKYCLDCFNKLCKDNKSFKDANAFHKFLFLKISELRDLSARKLDLEPKLIISDEELLDFCFQENLVFKFTERRKN
jgi:hypothetical protein